MNKIKIVKRYEYMGSDVVDGPCSNVECVYLVRDPINGAWVRPSDREWIIWLTDS